MSEFTSRTLAECLFDLEGSSIYNDPHSHWLVNDWFDKYGIDSIKHNDFQYPEQDVQKLAGIIEEDLLNNVLDSFEYDGGDSYDTYIGFITECFEKQLGIKTGIGYQLNLN